MTETDPKHPLLGERQKGQADQNRGLKEHRGNRDRQTVAPTPKPTA